MAIGLRWISSLSLCMALATAATAVAKPTGTVEIEGVRFADRREVDGRVLEVNCLALLRYKRIFRAYVAALYLGDGVPPADVLGDVPKRLELSYFWDLEGGDIGKAGDEILARNVDAETLARLRPRLERINALYEDIKAGDRYSLTYLPGVGTELALNDTRKGVIEGADFAAAYFRIWLGDNPIDASFRDELLHCEAARRSGVSNLAGDGRALD